MGSSLAQWRKPSGLPDPFTFQQKVVDTRQEEMWNEYSREVRGCGLLVVAKEAAQRAGLSSGINISPRSKPLPTKGSLRVQDVANMRSVGTTWAAILFAEAWRS